MNDHIVTIGYTPISMPELEDFDPSASVETTMELVSRKLSSLPIIGTMVFAQPVDQEGKEKDESGWAHDWYVMFIVENRCQELNKYLHAFINDETVKDVENKLELLINKDEEGSAMVGMIPNPLLSITRQKKIRSFSRMTLVMPIVSLLVKKYEGSTIADVKGEIDDKEVFVGYIDRFEMEEVMLAQEKDDQGYGTPMENFQLALALNDWPTAKVRYSEAEGYEGESFLRSAMKNVPNLVGEGENVSVMMIT